MAEKKESNKTKQGWKMRKLHTFDYVLVLIFLFIVFITIYPFLNVLAISLNDPVDTMRNVNFIIPRKFTWSNYVYTFTQNDLMKPFLMSVARTLIGTLVSVICTAMIGYVLSRRDFYFHKPLTFLFVITMYVSGGLIPEYLLLTRTLNLGNSFAVYIIPGIVWVFNIILVRSYIDGLPDALQEAARIDGANDFIIWYRIILPLCKPVLATIALFYAVGQWNSFMDTYLYARNLPTLQYVLYEIIENATVKVDPHTVTETARNTISPMSIRMAITIIATVPILVVYPFLQKYFVGGMTMGAVKD